MRRRSVALREYFLLDINAVVRFLIISDVIWGGAMALLGPIFAIFIIDFVEGGNAAVAGVAAAIYLITKSILQIPVATLIDKIRGERDDFWILFVGSLVGALIPLAYLFIRTPVQLYAVQFVYGVVIAMTFPSFMAIYTRHIDKAKEGTEWGIYFTLTDLSAAVAASIGGVLAETVGFHKLIVILAMISVVGVLMIFPIRPYLKMNAR